MVPVLFIESCFFTQEDDMNHTILSCMIGKSCIIAAYEKIGMFFPLMRDSQHQRDRRIEDRPPSIEELKEVNPVPTRVPGVRGRFQVLSS